jgi:release factor glutamine methyltransferase
VSGERLDVVAALAQARSRKVAQLDAQLLLAHLMAVSRTWLIAHGEASLDAELASSWEAWLTRRAAGEPLAYMLGQKEFRSLLLQVTPAVLIPRPETELLVDWAAALLDAQGGRGDIVDLGTGSGAIALAIRQSHPNTRVVATDSSPAALAVARANAERLSLPIEFVRTSWWQGLQGRRFDLVVANPPYVREDDPALATLRHEPRVALAAAGGGLGALRIIARGAAEHLRAGAWILLEHGFDQAESVRALLRESGLQDIETRPDLAGHPRATGARRAYGP